MTAPLTIRPQRTTAPSGIPALVDAEILAGQLVYTLAQIRQNMDLEWFARMGLRNALDAACDCQHHLTTLQMRLAKEVMPTTPATRNAETAEL